MLGRVSVFAKRDFPIMYRDPEPVRIEPAPEVGRMREIRRRICAVGAGTSIPRKS